MSAPFLINREERSFIFHRKRSKIIDKDEFEVNVYET